MDRARRKAFYNACKPDESLGPDDPRNVQLDEFGGPGNRPRGGVWAERLAERITFSEGPAPVLFSGLPGSGKSTELRRLLRILERDEAGKLFTLRIDAESVLDLSNTIDVSGLIAPLVHEVERAVLIAEGREAVSASQEGYLGRLWHFLTTTEVEFGKGELTVPGAPALVAELRTRPSFRERVRKVVAGHTDEFLGQARIELESLRARVQKLGYSDIFVVFDSLEKLRGSSTSWEGVLLSAENVFGGGAPYLRMPIKTL